MIKFTDDHEIQAAYDYYKSLGFPYVHLKRHEIIHTFRKLQSFKAKINKQKTSLFGVRQRKIELSPIGDSELANHFHPHIWESRAANMRSPVQSYNIEKSLKKVMSLCLKYDHEITDKGVRSYLRKVNGTQMCSNFRPAAAKTIYEYLGGDNVLDMCTGYGGRLLGFLASSCKGIYFGVDPNEKTCECNRNIAKEFSLEKKVKIICKPFEEVQKIPTMDIAFTSPPYFTKEIYDEGSKNQSRERYPEYEVWVKEFYIVMMEKVHTALSKNGAMGINIANVNIGNKCYPVADDTIRLATKIGFTYVERLDMVFPGFGKGLAKFKTEPVFIFRKV